MSELSFTLKRTVSFGRPYFYPEICGVEMSCLLDTGAYIPMYTKGERLFLNKFRDTEFVGKGTIGGIGGAVPASFYKVRKFSVSDGKQIITFNDLCIAVITDANIQYDVLLSESMFTRSKVVVDYLNGNNILYIKSEKDEFDTVFVKNLKAVYIPENNLLK